MQRTSRLAAAVAMFVATNVHAQPMSRPDGCKVSVALAPEGVREEIEAWVAAEPRCERELEVRVVPTENGLYLSARDPSGRVRERIVPDAQSAAVLVVSWMADDSIGPSFPALTPPMSVPAPPAPEALGQLSDDSELPSALRPIGSAHHDHTLAVGVIGGERNLGLRGQLDVFGRGRWVLGVGGGWAHDEVHGTGTAAGQARVFLGVRQSVGWLSMRAQVGVGADFVDGGHHMEMTGGADLMQHMHGAGHVAPAFELSLLGSMQLTKSWGLIGGPVLHARGDHGGEPGLSLLLGVTRRL